MNCGGCGHPWSRHIPKEAASASGIVCYPHDKECGCKGWVGRTQTPEPAPDIAAQVATLARQRDELLAALRDVLAIVREAVARDDIALEDYEEEDINKADAIIATLETAPATEETR